MPDTKGALARSRFIAALKEAMTKYGLDVGAVEQAHAGRWHLTPWTEYEGRESRAFVDVIVTTVDGAGKRGTLRLHFNGRDT